MAIKKAKDVIIKDEAAKVVAEAAKKAETVEKKVEKAAKEVKAEKPAEKKVAAAAKKVVKKAETAAAAVAKKAEKAVKKESTPKAEKATVILQFAGKDTKMTDVLEAAKKAYKAGNKEAIKSIVLYVKPEDNAAYYVVNDTVTGKIEL